LAYLVYLRAPLAKLLGAQFTVSQLADLLVVADHEMSRQAPEKDWPVFYADFFLDRYP